MSVLTDATAQLQGGHSLTVEQSRDCMELILGARAGEEEIRAWLLALREQGETAEELVGCAQVLRRHAVPLTLDPQGGEGFAVDTCGTGGDQAGTINVSTIAAFVAAGAGVPVLKHGNRSASSRCGSADLLEALGIEVDVPPETTAHCFQTAGLAFLFAPRFHPALKQVAPIRKALGVRTIFNLLGPLAHPLADGRLGVRVDRQVVGVSEARLVGIVAEACRQLGTHHALVVHGEDGLDEVTTTSPTRVAEVRSEAGHPIEECQLTPEEFGLSRSQPEQLRGGDVETNARLALELLEDPRHSSRQAHRELVLLNAACALYVAGRAGPAARNLRAGLPACLALAAQSLDGGRSRERLNFLRRCSQRRF